MNLKLAAKLLIFMDDNNQLMDTQSYANLKNLSIRMIKGYTIKPQSKVQQVKIWLLNEQRKDPNTLTWKIAAIRFARDNWSMSLLDAKNFIEEEIPAHLYYLN